MRKRTFPAVLTAATVPVLSFVASAADETVDFEKRVNPILESTCVTCHNEEKDKGDIRLDTKAAALASVSENDDPALVPGAPEKSGLFWTTVLPEDDDLIMPPKGDVLDQSQTEKLKA